MRPGWGWEDLRWHPAGAGRAERKPVNPGPVRITSKELGYHFVQWLAMRRLAQLEAKASTRCGPQAAPDFLAEINKMLSGLVLMHAPYSAKISARLEDGHIRCPPLQNEAAEPLDLLVLDEAHKIFRAREVPPFLEQELPRCKAKLLLSDDSQSSEVDQAFPTDLKRVRLTEVVRSTKRIVAGAAAFQLPLDRGEVTASIGADGPPLKAFIFRPALDELQDACDGSNREGCRTTSPPESGMDLFASYALHVVKALRHVEQSFPGVSWHRRVAILGPDDKFAKNLETSLQKRLQSELLHRRVQLVSFQDSLSRLPPRLHGHQLRRQESTECVVIDSIDKVDGLEMLVVIAVALDAAIEGSQQDLETRARLYRGLTRAQLLAVVVNEHVPGGWLEFLGKVKFKSTGALPQQETSPKNTLAAQRTRVDKFVGATAGAEDRKSEEAVKEGSSERPQRHREAKRPYEASTNQADSTVWDARECQMEISGLKFNPLARDERSLSPALSTFEILHFVYHDRRIRSAQHEARSRLIVNSDSTPRIKGILRGADGCGCMRCGPVQFFVSSEVSAPWRTRPRPCPSSRCP